jgi:hypothetical protein
VLPAEPPVVTITSAPSRVSTGQAIHVIADVTDNRVTFEVGGQGRDGHDPHGRCRS